MLQCCLFVDYNLLMIMANFCQLTPKLFNFIFLTDILCPKIIEGRELHVPIFIFYFVHIDLSLRSGCFVYYCVFVRNGFFYIPFLMIKRRQLRMSFNSSH